MRPRRPRAVLMTGDVVGGVWTYCLDLAGAFGRRGIDVVLATMGGEPTRDQRAAAGRLPRLELRAAALKLEWMDDPWDDVARSRDWIAGLAQRARPDVLHANTYAHGDLAVDAPRALVGHSCVLSWWRAVKGEDAPASWERYRAAVARGIAGADAVAAPTAAMLAALARHYGPHPRARVAPNGRDGGPYRSDAKRLVALAAGRFWDEAKNLACVDRAAARLAWPVRVAGDQVDPAGRSIRPRHASALGRLAADELAREYASAAVFLAPARYEPFGLAILEAALSGCALVLGDIPSLRETWDGCARFAHPDDDAAVAAATDELMRDADARAALVARSRARALDLGVERMADAALGLYEDASLARAQREGAACAS